MIICTKDRPIDLKVLLESMMSQASDIYEVIIVDGSDEPVENVVQSFKDILPIKYFTLRPPGLTRQRNFGISKLSPGTDWVGFLDDDLELVGDTVLNLKRFLSNNSDLGGVGLKIKNQPDPPKSFLKDLMLLDNFPGGVVTSSGAAGAIRPYEISREVDWLYGGATFWKKSVLDHYDFDEWFSGVGYCEDLDFSYGVSRSYKLMICAEAECYHHDKEIRVEKMIPMGEWSIVAWWYFARVKHKFNILLVLWSMFSLSAVNLIYSIIRMNRKNWNYFLGTLKGFGKIFSGRVVTHQGFQK